MRSSIWKTCFAAALLAIGCGDDSNGTSKPADMSVDEPDVGFDATTESDMETPPDVTSEDAGDEADASNDDPDFGPTIYPIIDDEEPNSERSEATAFTAPATLQGSVERETDPVDWWEVNVPGPSILELTIEGGDVGWIEVQTTDVSKRGLVGSAGTLREFFIPAPDRYQIGMVATEDRPSFDYSVTVRSYEATPVPLEDLTVTGDLDDGRVDVYSWISMGAGFTIAEVIGARDPVNSTIDSFLFVQDQTLGTFEANDDALAGEDDSRLDFDRRDGAEYWIAVDVYEPTDDHRYELRLQLN